MAALEEDGRHHPHAGRPHEVQTDEQRAVGEAWDFEQAEINHRLAAPGLVSLLPESPHHDERDADDHKGEDPRSELPFHEGKHDQQDRQSKEDCADGVHIGSGLSAISRPPSLRGALPRAVRKQPERRSSGDEGKGHIDEE